MSIDAVVAGGPWERRTARVGFGVTLAFLLAVSFNWPLAYLAPSFALPMLQDPSAPTTTGIAKLLGSTVLIALACLVLGGVARVFPIAFILALVGVLFLVFRYGQRGGSSIVFVLSLVGIMLVPMVAKSSWGAASDVAAALVWDIALATAVTVVIFAAWPVVPEPRSTPPAPPSTAGDPERRAWRLTLITGSYAVAYFTFDWTNVYTPLYIAAFAQSLSLARGRSAAITCVGANLLGGMIALLLYEVLAMAPLFLFMALLMLAVNLSFARRTTSGAADAPLFGAAFSVMLFVLGGAMSPAATNAAAGFVNRFTEIGLAAIYTVVALGLMETFLPERNALATEPANADDGARSPAQSR